MVNQDPTLVFTRTCQRPRRARPLSPLEVPRPMDTGKVSKRAAIDLTPALT